MGVIHKFHWGTMLLICNNGAAHSTATGLPLPGGQRKRTPTYKKITKRRNTYKPAGNFTAMDITMYRLLIRKIDPTDLAPPAKKPRMCAEVEEQTKYDKLLSRII